jgi:hypothetical protein
MNSNSPLVTIWNGLKKLESQHQQKKEKLLALLKEKKAISEDQNWLDGAANLVDEVCILEALEKAPDYESGLDFLSW